MIYRKPLFLPTLEDDKKKGSSVLLMTPNYESSKRLMQHPLLINRLRYQSYYAERNLTKFISSKVLDRVEEASFDEGDILQEKYLKNDSDIYYNKEKFDKGDINLCFITGHSGSGKSTMGRNLSKENVEHYELDDVLANKLRFTMGELEEYGDLIYSFFNGVGKKYYFTGEEEKTSQSPELNSIYYNGENYDEDITNDFVNYAIHYAESHKNAKFVIEGIWLYKYTNPSKLLDYAVCIKGTSAIVSAIRGLRRDIATDKSNGESPGLIERLRMIKAYTKRALIDEKKIEKWRKLFISKINESIETLLEATKYPEDIPEDIIQFSKELNKKYCYGVIFNGKPVANLDNFDFWDDYKSLSVSEFEKYKIGVCWDFVHYEAKWFKEHGYKYETYYVEAEDKDNDLPTHSFLVFYLPNSSKVYYFESSWGRYKGIEEFNNISTLLQTITKRHVEENEADLKSAFYVKYDASSSSLEHIGCGEYMKKASKGKTMLQEGAANRVSKFDWNVSGDKPPYHPVPIEKEYGIMAENRYNAIIKLKGYKPLRGRSEVLIVNHMDQVYLTKGKWGPYDYELPGGSWDKGEDHMQCVIREAMEEARIKIKDVEEYLPYVATYEPDDWQNEHIPKAMQWYGDYNQLYIAKYDGYYDGPVEKEDKENKMLRKGRFYDIKEVEKLLDPGHLTAICAYLYQGLGDKFIEDTLNAQDLVQKGTINETVMKSTIDKDFQKKGSKKLSSFKKLPLKKSLIDKFKDRSNFLRHVDERDNGFFYIDDSGDTEEFVAIVTVDDKGNDGTGDLKDYNFITAVEVAPKYRGYGLTKQLLDVAIKELKGEFLTVAYDNEVAIKAYKSYGFKISKNSYEAVKNGTSKSKMYTMFYHIRPGDNFELMSEEYVEERYLENEEDIYYNKEAFDRGDINLCFITGHSGSGKSTMGRNLSRENDNIEHYDLDIMVCNERYTIEQIKEYGGDLYYSFLTGPGKKWWHTRNKIKDMSIDDIKELGAGALGPLGSWDYNEMLTLDFVEYAIKYAKNHKDKKIILDGIWVLYIRPDALKDYAVYIKGTSVLKSSMRAFNRDRKNGVIHGDSKKLNWKQKAIAPMEYFIYRIKKEGVIDVYRNYFGNLVASAQQESFLFEKMDILQEDSKYDSQLKRLFYNDRIRQRKEIIELNKQVKIDMPFIKYIYVEPEKYKEKNLFVDYSYYNDIFFKNNDWDKKKGYELYTDLMERIFTDPMIKKLGYKKRTIFIPVLDWKREAGNVWSYRESINPISVFYELMRTNSDKLKMFGDTDIVFFGKDKYFKINFSQIEEEPRKLAFKYKMFVGKILAGQEFDLDDIDTSSESKESPKAIKANIIDKIEASKGVDLTGKDTVHGKMVPPEAITGHSIDKKSSVTTNVEKELSDKTLVKGKNTDELRKKEKDLQQLAKDIDRISQDAEDTEDAIDHMEDLKSIIIDLDSMGNDSAKVDPARAARMNKLDQQFLEKQVKGKTIRDILSEDPTKKELETTSLDIASPNEEWKTMTYMNFDKDYDLNRDILACLKHFQTVSNPISIRNIDVKNNSTSEDRVDLYTAEMEDSRGKRFSMKLDIPIMIDNRFLLRGNDKKINTQFCNMPIIKTDLDAAQIITNYQKVFIYRVNTVSGRSHPFAGRLLKAINKYKGKNLKLYYGDNGKICNKYELPVDYIDMASVLNKIETPTYIIYFNQDEIRRDYPNIDDSLGVPFAISKKDKQVKYFSIDRYGQMTFAATLFYEYLSEDEELKELFNKATEPTSGTYSRCNIMSSKIPMIVVLGYMEGLTKTLKKANINYQLVESLTKEIREQKNIKSWIRFKDGYLVYESTYTACMLLNGFKECSTDIYSIYDVDNKNTYLEMLDNFGGRIKADGLDNFYDCLVDPISKEVLEHYNLPTDVVSIFLYANMLLSDNKFTKHTDVSSRRIRRNEMVAAYAYEALSESYGSYANQMKHNKSNAEFIIKQSAVIDKLLASPISSDDSTINGLEAVEATNAITYKGKSGLNSERSYSLDKRTYDDSMINVLGASTGFSGNTGITRQTTIDMNVEGVRGYIRTTDGDISKMNASKTLTATEAVTPFGSTRDDGMRTAMTFIQTAKHTLRTEQSDPLLVTTGADEALAYLTTDKFAFKAKKNGKIKELTEEYIIIGYDDGTNDYVNLKETVEKNSDAGCYVPLKLDAIEGLRVGKKIKQNEVLAYDKLSFSNSVGETDNIAYNIGKLAKVAIINTDEGYEDSGVTIETMSEKLASRIIVCEDRVIDKDATIFSMVNVGDEVDVNDALLVWQDPYEEEDANILLKSLANDQEQVSELGRRTIRSEVAGKISDIRISRTVELEELSDSLRKIVNNYEKKIKTLKKKLDSEGIDSTHLPATYKLEPTGKLKNAQDAVKIEIFVEYRDIIAVGDKVTYYSANKAVTKAIIPKELAPYTSLRPNEPVDAFVSEVSIDKRMVGSTMSYGSIQKLMIELDRTVKDMAGIPYDDSKV